MIETEAVHLQGLDDEVLLQFHAGSSLRTDFGNWYVPTIPALHNLCRAAGFRDARTVVGPPPRPAEGPSLRKKVGSTAPGRDHPCRCPRARSTTAPSSTPSPEDNCRGGLPTGVQGSSSTIFPAVDPSPSGQPMTPGKRHVDRTFFSWRRC